jgi:Carboxypeptidase regulatory-like domain/Ankyrin repeats (3 copies)
MSARNLIDDFTINSPCEADWDSMTGNDQFRFCQHCQLSVHNLAQMTGKQMRRLVRDSGGRLCVRYARQSIMTAAPIQIMHRISRRTSLIAASAFTATLSVAGAMAANPHAGRFGADSRFAYGASNSLTETQTGGGTIKGTIFDPNGAVIPGAKVVISNPEANTVLSTFTDSNGEYKFDGLEAGAYDLRVEAEGFATTDVPNFIVRTNDENRIDQTLSIATVSEVVEVTGGPTEMVTMGAIAIAPTEPLVKAAEDDDLDAVRAILLEQRDANVRDKRTDWSPLECAVRNANRDMVQILLWAKADVNARDGGGQTVLMMLGENDTTDIVWDLLNAGAKVNARDKDGDTALMEAAQTNNVEVLKTLLDAGAKVNATNNDRKTALMYAAAEGHVNNVRTLLLAGADINARDKEGKSALLHASDNDHRPVVRLLKSYGAVEFEPPEK